MPNIDRKSAVMFANQLRSARLAALADAEAFDGIIHVVERLGWYLWKEKAEKYGTLGQYRKDLCSLADRADVTWAPTRPSQQFGKLYDLVREARNDALHQGAFARHLTAHAIELAIILEDALSRIMESIVADFMTQGMTCAELWQPVSFIRQQMLANSYSCLPVTKDDKWHLVSDASIAHFLGRNKDRIKRLSATLLEASQTSSFPDRTLQLPPAQLIEEEDSLDKALSYFSRTDESDLGTREALLLVCRSLRPSFDVAEPRTKRPPVIVGLITAFDLL